MKRLLGKTWDDEFIKTNQPYWSFNLEKYMELNPETNDAELIPSVPVKIQGETRIITPADVSSLILKKMKETAENFTKTKINKAVISIPAYFNQFQRKATIKAAEMAGIDVLSLISEPAAAAYAYGLDRKDFEECHILVFDFGGGTLDIVVLKYQDGIFRILTIGGDPNLGGRDLDNALVAHVANRIAKEYKKECFEEPKLRHKLLKRCSRVKELLSSTKDVE